MRARHSQPQSRLPRSCSSKPKIDHSLIGANASSVKGVNSSPVIMAHYYCLDCAALTPDDYKAEVPLQNGWRVGLRQGRVDVYLLASGTRFD